MRFNKEERGLLHISLSTRQNLSSYIKYTSSQRAFI